MLNTSVRRDSLRQGFLFALLLSLFVFFSASPVAVAETPSPTVSRPVVVATVNIYDAKITSRQGGTFDISFELSNREGAQPDIRYAVELLNGQTSIDETVYPDVTNLESNSSVVKNVRYTAPAYLVGAYEMRLVSKNASGLTLARASLGPVTLEGTGVYAEILPSSCFLTVPGESGGKTYTLDQGVDIAPTESLELTCTLDNRSSSALVLRPSFETYHRDVFGQRVETPVSDTPSVSVGAGTSTVFTLSLPKASAPQAYDVKLFFTNPTNVPTNSITAHYVLRGESATIQNITLDKTSYAAGDTAHISLFWTGPASNFFDARMAPSASADLRAAVTISGSSGACGTETEAALDPQYSTQTIQFPVTGACDSPKVSVRLIDPKGNALASSSFDFQSAVPSKKSGGNTLMYGLIALAALGVLYGVWRAFQGKAGGTALMLAGLCIMSYGLPSAAHADTFTQDVYLVSSGGWAGNFTFTYDVSLNKATFAPGETMTAAGNVTMGNCGNSLTGSFTALINEQQKDVYRSILRVLGPGNYHVEASITSNTFNAPMSPGAYIAQFFPELHVPNAGPGAGSYFSVAGAGTEAGGDEGGGDAPGSAMGFGGNKRGGASMVRDWVGTIPYEMPYTVSGSCTPVSRTCQASGNLQDNCGGVTSCQFGCSTATNQCNTEPPSCTVVSRVCQANGNLQDNCGNTTPCQYGCSTQTNQCNQCATGFTPSGNQCVRQCTDGGLIGTIANWFGAGGSCSCPAGSNTYNGQCISCPGTSTFINGQCVPTQCPPGQYRLSGQCVATCPSGQHAYNGQCIACQAGQVFSAGQCLSSCPAGTRKQGNVCVSTSCPVGYTMTQGQCVFTQCPAGYVRSGTTCELTSCPVGYERDTDGTCSFTQCPAGYTKQGTECISSQCPATFFYCGTGGDTGKLYRRTYGTAPACSTSDSLFTTCERGCDVTRGACNFDASSDNDISARPSLVRTGDRSIISWRVLDATSCTVTGSNGLDAWSCEGRDCLGMSRQTSPLSEQTTYRLSCLEPQLNKSVTVNIVPVHIQK